jgi:tetratricopeptide (TPR) repeat protein
MNLNKEHNSSQSNLSREDIERYCNSKDESLKYSIEKNTLENDFDTDALEGWSMETEIPLTMKRLDKKFGVRNKLNFILIPSIAIILIILTIFVFVPKNKVQRKTSLSASRKTSIKVEQTDINTPEKIDVMVELPIRQQISIQTIINDFSEQKEEQPNIINSEPINDLHISKIEEKKKELTLEKISFLGKEIYFYDLKLIDYRAYRSRPKIITKQMILTGTPANIGENSESVETTEWKDVEIPYIDYLDKTMELFSKGNNKKALSRLLIILNTYPDDINANFYAGLCFYNLKEYKSSFSSFEKCIDSKYINFSEEAEWYMAKSLLADGYKSEGQEILKKIKTIGGYYAKQADKLLATF